MVLHTHISSGGWTIGPLEATVRRHSLIPSIWTWTWNQRVNTVFISLPLVPDQCQLNPIHALLPYFLKIHYNIILSSTPRAYKWSLPLMLSNQNTVYTSHLPQCSLHSPPTSSLLIWSSWQYVVNSTPYKAAHYAVFSSLFFTSSLLGLNILLNTLFSISQ
jgi:hypothetical protein